MNAKKEHLLKSLHDVTFLIENLRFALQNSSSVESIIILPMIKTASELRRDIENLKTSIDSDEENKS